MDNMSPVEIALYSQEKKKFNKRQIEERDTRKKLGQSAKTKEELTIEGDAFYERVTKEIAEARKLIKDTAFKIASCITGGLIEKKTEEQIKESILILEVKELNGEVKGLIANYTVLFIRIFKLTDYDNKLNLQDPDLRSYFASQLKKHLQDIDQIIEFSQSPKTDGGKLFITNNSSDNVTSSFRKDESVEPSLNSVDTTNYSKERENIDNYVIELGKIYQDPEATLAIYLLDLNIEQNLTEDEKKAFANLIKESIKEMTEITNDTAKEGSIPKNSGYDPFYKKIASGMAFLCMGRSFPTFYEKSQVLTVTSNDVTKEKSDDIIGIGGQLYGILHKFIEGILTFITRRAQLIKTWLTSTSLSSVSLKSDDKVHVTNTDVAKVPSSRETESVEKNQEH